MQIMEVIVDGDKLWVRGDLETREFYLPDSNQKQIQEFLRVSCAEIAEALDAERPWMKEVQNEREAD